MKLRERLFSRFCAHYCKTDNFKQELHKAYASGYSDGYSDGYQHGYDEGFNALTRTAEYATVIDESSSVKTNKII